MVRKCRCGRWTPDFLCSRCANEELWRFAVNDEIEAEEAENQEMKVDKEDKDDAILKALIILGEEGGMIKRKVGVIRKIFAEAKVTEDDLRKELVEYDLSEQEIEALIEAVFRENDSQMLNLAYGF